MNQNYSPPPAYNTQQQTSGLATASLVTGILSWRGLAVIGLPVVAIICGHLALGQIKRAGGLKGGRGLAVAGLVLGYVSLLIGTAILLFFFGLIGVGMKMESAERERTRQVMEQIDKDKKAREQKNAAEKTQSRQWREQSDQQAEARRISIPPAALQRYVGGYNYQPAGFDIMLDGSTLRTRTREAQCELVPVAEHEFIFAKCTNDFTGRAKFIFGDNDKVDSLVIVYRDGREAKFNKY